jgi:hypothetical protein
MEIIKNGYDVSSQDSRRRNLHLALNGSSNKSTIRSDFINAKKKTVDNATYFNSLFKITEAAHFTNLYPCIKKKNIHFSVGGANGSRRHTNLSKQKLVFPYTRGCKTSILQISQECIVLNNVSVHYVDFIVNDKGDTNKG